MINKISVFFLSLLILINLTGCVAVVAGTAGGAGTATWLSGKLGEEFNVPLKRSVEATKAALNSLKYEITKETSKEEVVQIMSKYTDGRTIWIDVRKVEESKSRIEVRVGAISDKEAAREILERIKRYI